MTFTLAEHERLRDAMIDVAAAPDVLAEVDARTGLAAEEMLTGVPQARAHPMARRGRDTETVAIVLEEAIGRHQALMAHAFELTDARRDLDGAEDERWSVRVAEANRERLAADSRIVAREMENTDDSTESAIQRLLDAEVWRRSR